jgi:hypothetical protein
MELVLPAVTGLCAALTLSSLARAVRLRPRLHDTAPWAVSALWGCLTAACLTWLGAAGLAPGIIAAMALAVLAVAGLRRSGAAGAHLGAGPAHLWRDAASMAGAARRLASRLAARRDDDDDDGEYAAPLRHRRAQGPGPAADAPAADAPAAAARTVPSLRDDPRLGPAPAEAAAAAGPVPPPWAELAGWIASYVPEDDNAQTAFLAGNAAGLVAVAAAFGAHSETVINDIGLDPAYGAAILEVAGRVAETSGDVALADQRYQVIYGELKQAVENGLILPHEARKWLGGGGPAPAAGGTAAA